MDRQDKKAKLLFFMSFILFIHVNIFEETFYLSWPKDKTGVSIHVN